MKKVFIFGYYGFKNLGDEAILSSIIQTIKENNSAAEIYALSYNVKYTEKMHGIIGVSRNNLVEIVKTIKNADLVISGGGSLLQDVTSNRSLWYYLAIIGMAKLFKKPVIFYSNGFGPIRRRFNQWITRKIVNRVDQITVRDGYSKAVMENMGITHYIEVTVDATFILNGVDKTRAQQFLKTEGIAVDKPLVGISVRPWHVKAHFIDTMAKFADYLIDQGISVIFIPMQNPKDLEISMQIMGRMKKEANILKNEYKPEEMLGVIGVLDALVGMRLHALIFAGIMGTPMLGLDYDPKISAFLESIHQKNVGKVEKLDHLHLCIEFDKLWAKRKTHSMQLLEIVDEFKIKARRNQEILGKMMN